MINPAEGKNVVIIGSGVGGLSTGIILSLLNYSVTIVEKNPLLLVRVTQKTPRRKRS